MLLVYIILLCEIDFALFFIMKFMTSIICVKIHMISFFLQMKYLRDLQTYIRTGRLQPMSNPLVLPPGAEQTIYLV